jgi:hypothetical protein
LTAAIFAAETQEEEVDALDPLLWMMLSLDFKGAGSPTFSRVRTI